jgi:hypothetical protein
MHILIIKKLKLKQQQQQKKHTKISPHPVRMTTIRTPPPPNIGKDAGKRNPHTLLVGM